MSGYERHYISEEISFENAYNGQTISVLCLWQRGAINSQFTQVFLPVIFASMSSSISSLARADNLLKLSKVCKK